MRQDERGTAAARPRWRAPSSRRQRNVVHDACAPASRHAAATSGLVVSIETQRALSRRSARPSRTRSSCSRAGTGLRARPRRLPADVDDVGALGEELVDARARRSSRSKKRPPSLKESGVTLQMPINATPRRDLAFSSTVASLSLLDQTLPLELRIERPGDPRTSVLPIFPPFSTRLPLPQLDAKTPRGTQVPAPMAEAPPLHGLAIHGPSGNRAKHRGDSKLSIRMIAGFGRITA